jgi:hypothetical protein
MKISLSYDTVEFIKRYDCEIASAANDIEAELMEKVREQLTWGRDEQTGKYNLTRDVFDFVMAALDWYCGAYYAEVENNNK